MKLNWIVTLIALVLGIVGSAQVLTAQNAPPADAKYWCVASASGHDNFWEAARRGASLAAVTADFDRAAKSALPEGVHAGEVETACSGYGAYLAFAQHSHEGYADAVHSHSGYAASEHSHGGSVTRTGNGEAGSPGPTLSERPEPAAEPTPALQSFRCEAHNVRGSRSAYSNIEAADAAAAEALMRERVSLHIYDGSITCSAQGGRR